MAEMGEDDVEIESRETVFSGYFRVDQYRLRHRLFAGGWSDSAGREVFERGHAVAVILYDPYRDLLVLIEQFRIGAFAALRAEPHLAGTRTPWLLEVVAGIIDDGESPETVARREAMEEAGCKILEMEPVCKFLLSPGVMTESLELFCGRVDARGVGGIHGLEHEHEDIRVVAVPVVEAFRWLDEGRFVNATALVAMLWFRLNHDDLRRRWRR
ncbi:MAG TPA: NUDIX domain-containing protein [Rhodospirillales bacterium]|nr:NUDIX domain-containing protein [Rhodospirillales bacterium]